VGEIRKSARIRKKKKTMEKAYTMFFHLRKAVKDEVNESQQEAFSSR